MSRRCKYPNHPILGVEILIKDKDNYLLIKRATNPDKGLWSVPGGLIEVGEKATDADVREALEETCLHVKIKERLGIIDKIEYDEHGEVMYHFVILQFLAEKVSGEMKRMDDALDAKWVTLDQLPDYQITTSLRTRSECVHGN